MASGRMLNLLNNSLQGILAFALAIVLHLSFFGW